MNIGERILNSYIFSEEMKIDLESQISNNIYNQIYEEIYWKILFFLDFGIGIPIRDQMFKV